MSHICHKNVTEMSQKSPWLSFGGEFLLKNSEFPSSFPIWGTLFLASQRLTQIGVVNQIGPKGPQGIGYGIVTGLSHGYIGF